MICSTCGTENREGRRFCLSCGTPIASGCPHCGATTNEAEARFCGECGGTLVPGVAAGMASVATPPSQAPVSGTSERRLVSVLFADLVDSTRLATDHDAEEVRELLDHYYGRAREVVRRYGGTVEKFIGDAVMAVWGAPVAHEDDPERAVRAALDVVAAVAALGNEVGLPLEARAAVLTGEAAVTVGAQGQGLVAGDLVNTAARLQSVAPPGSVLVGEETQRAAGSAITFEAAGDQVLRGKEAPVAAWRAVAVVAKRSGAGRSEGVEPPFTGRDEEFALLKEAVHATGRERRPRLVSIMGVAGIGKSRLAWELLKYVDGLVETIYWHEGRSPAYGEGLAFWALGEMIRRRADIAETDDEATTGQKLDASLAELVADEDERRWMRPHLRVLLGLGEPSEAQREEVFAAWRTYFERVADRGTTLMVFEDLHWADAGLLDFIESMLEWTRDRPIMVVTLARPELLERRPTWGAGQRHVTSLHLDPLPEATMQELVARLAPGLPEAAARSIVTRAEGIPLYAVETFRMLVDRGDLAVRDGRYSLVGELGELEVPGSLQALIAARLDALAPEDRAIVQMASVLGLTFVAAALADVAGSSAAELEPRLRSLVRREVLRYDADPRSPERGQYGFVQSLIREVAYATIGRRERRALHVSAARHYEALGDDELAGVLASHYLAAYQASPPGPEAETIGVQARLALRGAAERAIALRAPEHALGYLDQALAVTKEPAEATRLHEEAARAAHMALRYAAAEKHARRAIEGYREGGDAAGVARATAVLGQVLLFDSRIEPAIEALGTALRGMPDAESTREGVDLMALLARGHLFANEATPALELIERGLGAAARIDHAPAIADLLVSRSWGLSFLGRQREAMALLEGAIVMADQLGDLQTMMRARNNLANWVGASDPSRGLEIARPAIEAAERIGDADWLGKLAFVAWLAFEAGDWHEAEAMLERRFHADLPLLSWIPLAAVRVLIDTMRGDEPPVGLRDELMRRALAGSPQDAWVGHWCSSWLAILDDDPPAAGRAVEGMLATLPGDWIEPEQIQAVSGAWFDDPAAFRAGRDGLAAMPAAFESVVAVRRLLDGLEPAMDGRPVRTAADIAEAAAVLRRVGCAWKLLHYQVAVGSYLPADDPVGRAARAEALALADGWGAAALRRRIGERFERADRAAARRTPRELDETGEVGRRSASREAQPQ
ncbi:MAG TPA: adenylate/guanylate cyclase domain-containing protein [Candidatus Limnocylindrales bacterium]|nr:adenylate/guanylate cyclase domain-containing protein [Candidatus Limnocylindrales bacterium]